MPVLLEMLPKVQSFVFSKKLALLAVVAFKGIPFNDHLFGVYKQLHRQFLQGQTFTALCDSVLRSVQISQALVTASGSRMFSPLTLLSGLIGLDFEVIADDYT